MSIWSISVGGQLHEPTTSRPTLRNRPLEELLAKTATAAGGRNSHRLYLTAPCAFTGNAGNEAELQCADKLFIIQRDYKQLVRIVFDSFKGSEIPWIKRQPRILPPPTQRVIDEQADNGREVTGGCTPKRHFWSI